MLADLSAVDLRIDLQRLAAGEGYACPEALEAAIDSGEVGPESWVAWEYRSLSLMLADSIYLKG
jgi:hypothetical protein